MNFEVETAFPCAARFRVVGKRDAGSDAPAGVRFVGGHGDMASFLCGEKIHLRTEEHGEEGEDDEEAEVPEGEDAQEGGFLLGIVFTEKFEGDEAGQRCDEGAEAAEIDGGAEGGEIAGEAGEQNGGGNVADDLAGEDAEPEFATVHEGDEEGADGGNASDVADEDEEAEKCREQAVINLAEEAAVDDKNNGDDNEEHGAVGQNAENDEQAECEQREKGQHGTTEVLRRRDLGARFVAGETVGEGRFAHAADAEDEQDEGEGGVGPDGPGEISEGHFGDGVEIEILRIADGGGHAAEVGGDGLENDELEHAVFALDHAENEDGKGNEGDEADVVGDDHAGEKAEQDHDGVEHAQAVGFFDERLSEQGEDAEMLQSGDNDHETEEQREGAVVGIREPGAVGMHDEGRNEREHKSDGKHGFLS